MYICESLIRTQNRLRTPEAWSYAETGSQPPPSTPGPKTEKKLDPMSVDKEEGSATKAMSVEKPPAEDAPKSPIAKQELFRSPAPKKQVQEEAWDWTWSSWGWCGWGANWGHRDDWWQQPVEEPQVPSRHEALEWRKAPSVVSEASDATTATWVHVALNRAPTAAEKLDVIAEQGGDGVQDELNKVFEKLDLDDAAATQPSPEKANPDATRLKDGSLHIDQQETQSFKTADQESLSGATTTTATETKQSPTEDPEGPTQDLRRGKPLEATEAEDKGKDDWKQDKRGRPLTPAALYQRFYRSARSALLHVYRAEYL